MLALVQSDPIRDLETLRQKRHQTVIKLVQLLPQCLDLWIVHRRAFYTATPAAASTTFLNSITGMNPTAKDKRPVLQGR